jgi:imidazolonepropionase-like amidohydrolase
LIDAHFHLDGDEGLPSLFLSHGVTSVRDPGAWMEAYDGARQSGRPLPRLFLAGPHLDNAPPAYPNDAFIVRDAEETRLAVNRFVGQGASVIKVYFRLPLGLIRVAVETAHARGVPVTAHLEIVDAADAIRAGVDGIEHVTSFGTALLPPREAEKYRQAMLADNNARREGRYKVWSELDLNAPRVHPLLALIAQRGTFVSPTLAVFEKQAGDKEATETHVRAFSQMLKFVGMVKRAGGRVVVGSHSSVPHAERGWAYQRELELLVASGLSPTEALVAGTMQNARFFRIADRLGSIEAGKLADLILIDGDPLKDLAALRRIKRVMLNGKWVEPSSEKK